MLNFNFFGRSKPLPYGAFVGRWLAAAIRLPLLRGEASCVGAVHTLLTHSKTLKAFTLFEIFIKFFRKRDSPLRSGGTPR